MASVGSPKAKSSARRQVLGACFFLVAISWLVFGQTVRYDFVNYDDNEYVYANPAITSGLNPHGIIYAFSGTQARNWHPLTTLSHMLDCQMWESAPAVITLQILSSTPSQSSCCFSYYNK